MRSALLLMSLQLMASAVVAQKEPCESCRSITVSVFFGLDCPISQKYVPRLNELVKTYASFRWEFLVPAEVKRKEISTFRKEYQPGFDLVVDPSMKQTMKFGVTITPEVVVADATGQVLYQVRSTTGFMNWAGTGSSSPSTTWRMPSMRLPRASPYRSPVPRPSDVLFRCPHTIITDPMRKAMLAGVLSGLGCVAVAQSGLTYYKDIEPILLNNCAGCHKEDGIAPFPLLGYDDVKKRGDFLVKVTKTRYMPPWKADPTFQTYKNELILPDSTLATIENWVKAGMPKGKKVTHAAPLVHPENLAKPDLSVKMLRPHKLSATGLEDFRYFVIPTNLPEHTWISSIEFVPGNKRAVHHTRIMVDTTQKMRSMDGISARDPLVAEYQKIPILEEFLYGWAPGNTPIFFPPGTAKLLPRGTDFILNVHYSPSARVQEDQSTINVYFARTPANREILTLTLREADISNQPFFIPAGTSPSFFFSVPVKKDISVISVLPHMHYLGKNFRAFAVTPSGEVINLIRINRWDFRWQTMYQFKKMLHIPAGSVIVAEAMFDNTADNPDNPTSPPKDVGFGWNTTDEMCNLVMYFLEYQEGDEEIEY